VCGPPGKGLSVTRNRLRLAALVAVLSVCAGVVGSFLIISRHPGSDPATRSQFLVRAGRRAYDGAPPVIPHQPLGGACTTCHTGTARAVPGIGTAPPNPHLQTAGLSESSNCRQCHVFQRTMETLVASDFQPLPQHLRKGDRLDAYAPPVIPHGVFMREDCAACHGGVAARPEIRCTHPERLNCVQCHVPQVARL
jgi:cytochrome c-type protein NapB